MDPGYRSPLVDFFRRSEGARDARLLAAQGALSAAALEQLALLLLLVDDEDAEIASTAQATIEALPEEPLKSFLAVPDVPTEIRRFFAERGIAPAEVPPADPTEPLIGVDDEDDDEDENLEEEQAGASSGKPESKILAGLPIKRKIKLASKGTREQRAQLIRDPNKLVAAAVLSSPKLTDAEVESFAKMANVSEEVLRVIGMNRTWLKNYGVVLGLVKNPKSPPAISMQLLPRLVEKDMRMLSMDRNIPEAVRLAARRYLVKSNR